MTSNLTRRNHWSRTLSTALSKVLSKCLAGTLALLLVPQIEAGEPKEIAAGVPSGRGVAARASGGPDAFGYTFEDQNEASCPHQLTDLRASGTLIDWGVGGSDDNSSGALALGASFDFYGTDYTQLNVSTNGYISTDLDELGTSLGTGDPPSMCPLPAELLSGGGSRIYPLLDDLVTNTAYVEYFAVCPRSSDRCRATEDCTIVHWADTHHFGNSFETFDIQTVLYHQTADIVTLVGPGNPELGAASTTGIQSSPATGGPPYPTDVPASGLVYACDTADTIQDENTVCFRSPNEIPDPCVFSDLALDLDSDVTLPRLEPGTEVVLTFSATNDGPDDARGANVTVEIDPDLTYLSDDCEAGSPAGTTWTWTIDNLPDAGLQACNLTVEVTGDRGESVSVSGSLGLDNFDPDTTDNDSETVAFDIGFISDLALTKTSDAGVTVDQGSPVLYTLTVDNVGPDSSVAAAVNDQLPAEVTYVSNDCGAADPVAGLFTWTVGELAAAGTASCVVTATVTGDFGDEVINQAEVVVENIEPDPTDNLSEEVSFLIGPLSDLSVVKVSDFEDNAQPFLVPVTYTLTVSNAGPDDSDGVLVTDLLPESISYLGNTCGADPPVANEFTWDIGALAAGSSVVCEVSTQLMVTELATIVNTVQIASDNFDPEPGDDQSSVSFVVTGPGFLFADGFESGDLSGWE